MYISKLLKHVCKLFFNTSFRLVLSRFLPSIAFPSSSATSITCLFLLYRIVNSPYFSANFVLLTFPCLFTNSSYSWIIFCFCLKSRTFLLLDLLAPFIFTNNVERYTEETKVWIPVSTFVVSYFPYSTPCFVTKAAVSKHPGAINAMILQWNKVTPFSVPKNNVR